MSAEKHLVGMYSEAYGLTHILILCMLYDQQLLQKAVVTESFPNLLSAQSV